MKLAGRVRSRIANPDVAIAHTFVKPPWGGSNQFLLALRGELERRGLRVAANAISRRTRACLLNAYLVDEELLRDLLHPHCRVVHRVDGPLATYRGFDDGTDTRIAELNREFAHVTVLQSRYSLEEHGRRGIPLREPVLIPNAVDPAIFHPPPERRALRGRRVRVIATSWSDNPRKGGPTYKWLEEHLDSRRYEFTLVGRSDPPLERARVVPPLGSEALAGLLRSHDVYLTASLHDPCSNALLEALACGLPAVYADSGGHPELVGDAGFGFRAPEEIPALLDRLVEDYDERRAAIRVPSLSEVADGYLAAMGLP